MIEQPMTTDFTALVDETGLTDAERDRVAETATEFVITLREPIRFIANKLDGEQTLKELTLPRGVKGKHLKAMDQAQGEMGKGMALIARLAGVPASAMDEVDARDIVLCLEAMEPFLPGQRRTGTR